MGYKDNRIRELETKCEGLEKIRKDILCTVNMVESSYRAEEQEPSTAIKKDRNLPYVVANGS